MPSRRSIATAEAAYRARLLDQLRRITVSAQHTWTAAFDKLRKDPNQAELLSAIQSQSVVEIERVFRLEHLAELLHNPEALGRSFAFEDATRRALLSVSEISAQNLSKRLNLPIESRFMKDRAELWLRQHGTQFVREMTDGSRAVLRQVMTDAAVDGLSIVRTAEQLREHLPLTEAWSTAVSRYERELLSAGVNQEKASRLARVYADRLKTRRAMNVAQTEISRAGRMAESGMMRESAFRGLIDEAVYEREWVAILDASLCQICRREHGNRAPINGNFPNGSQEAEGHDSNCRCGSRLVRKDEAAPTVPAFVAPKKGGSLRPMTPAEAAS